MKRYGKPWSIVTDRLRSYGAALLEFFLEAAHVIKAHYAGQLIRHAQIGRASVLAVG